jgi:hypothetical protein
LLEKNSRTPTADFFSPARDYKTQFIHREKPCRFALKGPGCWIDVTTAPAAIHMALKDAGVSEGFVPHAESGGLGPFLFANPASLRNASGESICR